MFFKLSYNYILWFWICFAPVRLMRSNEIVSTPLRHRSTLIILMHIIEQNTFNYSLHNLSMNGYLALIYSPLILRERDLSNKSAAIRCVTASTFISLDQWGNGAELTKFASSWLITQTSAQRPASYIFARGLWNDQIYKYLYNYCI